MCHVYLDSVETSLVAQVSHLAPLLHQIFDLRNGKRSGSIKGIASPCNLELDVACTDRIRIQRGTYKVMGERVSECLASGGGGCG